MTKRQVALTKARITLSQMAHKGAIRPGEVVEITRRGRVVLILERPEDFVRRLTRKSKAAKPGILWGTAALLGDLDDASRHAESRLRASLRRRVKQL